MASIPADSKAFIKPFEGTDVTCLILDVVAWFGADEIVSILNQNLCSAIKNLPLSQKALWRQLEPQVHSEKQFITSLGVRMLIGRAQNIECKTPQQTCNIVAGQRRESFVPHTASYYNNTPIIDPNSSTACSTNPCAQNNPLTNTTCTLAPTNYINNYPTNYPPCNYPNNFPANAPTSSVCYNQPRFELSPCLHNLGNIFIDEAIYDARAYPQLEEVNCKINRIYDILLNREITTT
uniref:ORF20 n=1 Tax=Cydia pomonella granulosis virus TaxID=28289 RepID=A0A6B9I4N7_GVCP|nr:ORF20 [Cydia pomonella granulovirus]QGZ00029.1 ORF20 [Cydia pomonella granulovirus]